MNRRAHEPHLHRSRSPRPLDLQCHGSARLPAQRFGCLFARPSLGGLAHDLDDAVSRLQSRALSGSAGQRCDDDQPAISKIRLEPQAGVVAAGGLVEPGETLRRKERRVRIPQLVQHPVHRFAVERRIADRVDEVVLHVAQNVVEQLSALELGKCSGARASLQQPSAGDERSEQRAGDDYRASARRCAGKSEFHTLFNS